MNSQMPHIQHIETAVNKVASACAHANCTRTNGTGPLAQLCAAPECHNICQITPASLSSVFTPLAIYPFAVLNGFTALSLRRGECDDVALRWQSVHLPWHCWITLKRPACLMKQFSYIEIISTVVLLAIVVVVVDSSRVFHAIDSATLQLVHRCTPAPYGMLAVPAALPTHSFGDMDHLDSDLRTLCWM